MKAEPESDEKLSILMMVIIGCFVVDKYSRECKSEGQRDQFDRILNISKYFDAKHSDASPVESKEISESKSERIFYESWEWSDISRQGTLNNSDSKFNPSVHFSRVMISISKRSFIV